MLIPSPGAQTKHNEMKGDTPMKKMLALILTMSLVFALLTACGGDQSGISLTAKILAIPPLHNPVEVKTVPPIFLKR